MSRAGPRVSALREVIRTVASAASAVGPDVRSDARAPHRFRAPSAASRFLPAGRPRRCGRAPQGRTLHRFNAPPRSPARGRCRQRWTRRRPRAARRLGERGRTPALASVIHRRRCSRVMLALRSAGRDVSSTPSPRLALHARRAERPRVARVGVARAAARAGRRRARGRARARRAPRRGARGRGAPRDRGLERGGLLERGDRVGIARPGPAGACLLAKARRAQPLTDSPIARRSSGGKLGGERLGLAVASAATSTRACSAAPSAPSGRSHAPRARAPRRRRACPPRAPRATAAAAAQ